MEFDRIADKKRVKYISSVINASVEHGSYILDVGCGNGLISKAVAKLNYLVDGIDVSEKTIAQARATNFHPNINYRVVEAGNLQPNPGYYSAIICSEVLEHLHKPDLLLTVLHTSLQNNGVLIVTVPNGTGPRELFVTRPVQYINKKDNAFSRVMHRAKKAMGYSGTTVQSSADDLSHVQFFTSSALRRLAASTGFRIEEWAASNFIEQVFPFSLLTKRSQLLQRLDCQVADLLPLVFTSGFMMVWKKL